MSSVSIIFIIAFWSCVGLIVYTYAIYAPLVFCFSRMIGRDRTADEANSNNVPMISLLIVAHNEEAVIEQRLRNALAVDYPKDRFGIVVASDASSDKTNEIVRRFADQGVRLIEFSQRRGKAAAINRAMPMLQSDIILMSDANTEFDPQVARKLVRWFGDSSIGIVCGRLILTDPQTGRNVDSIYWRYETMLKQCESRLGGLLVANGAIYAIRRSVFCLVPDGTIVDDFVIPLVAKLRNGCGIHYESEAVAREQSAPEVHDEFRRRTRIGTGNFQALALLWRLLDPRRGFVAFAFLSHKVLRWLCPFFVIGLLFSSTALDRPFYRIALCTELALLAIACGVMLAPSQIKIPRLLALAAMFVSMNAALLLGFWNWLTRSRQGTWDPTVRASLLEKKSG